MTFRNASLLVMATASFALTAPLQGQSSDAANRADTRQARLDRLSGEGPRGRDVGPAAALLDSTRPPLVLTLTAPFTYASNVEFADGDNKKQAFHATPSARLDWSSARTGAVIFVRALADADYYTSHEDNDASTLLGRVGVRFVGKEGAFVPYAHYTPTIIYGRGFGNHQVTLHNFAVGVGRTIDLRGGTSLTFDVQVLRREATAVASEQYRAALTVSLAGDVGSGIGWGVDVGTQGRFYTGGTNDGRTDLNLNTNAALSVPISSKATIDVGVSFERNESDRPGRDYSTWDIGPSLSLRWPLGGG